MNALNTSYLEKALRSLEEYIPFIDHLNTEVSKVPIA